MIKFALIAFSIIGIATSLVARTIGKNIVSNYTTNYKVVYVFFLVLFTLCVLVYGLGENFPFVITKNIYKIVYIYFAFLFYAVILFSISRIILFLVNFKYIYHISTGLIIVLVIFGNIMRHRIVIREYNITTSKRLPKENLKIALVSDTHFGYIIDNDDMEKLVKMLNNAQVDMILFPGDFADKEIDPLLEMDLFSQMKEIEAQYGTYLSLGNHDLFDIKVQMMVDSLRENKITVLRGEMVQIDNIIIAGKDWGSKDKLSDILSVPNDETYNIYVYHEPREDAIDEAKENGIDLMVAGHTHGGQMFPVNLITRRLFPIDYGHKRFDKTDVIVSSGFGVWGPPVRIGSRSEMCIIHLRYVED